MSAIAILLLCVFAIAQACNPSSTNIGSNYIHYSAELRIAGILNGHYR
jgi:hypothetical protein